MHYILLMFTLQFGDGTAAKVLTVNVPTHTYEFHFAGIQDVDADDLGLGS